MGILWWVLIGLALGFLARWVTGRRIGIFYTLAAGLIGALIGGFIGHFVGWGGIVKDFSPWSLVLAAAVAIVALLVLTSVRRRRRLRT